MSEANYNDKRGHLDNALSFIGNKALLVARSVATKVAHELNTQGSQQLFISLGCRCVSPPHLNSNTVLYVSELKFQTA